MAGSRVVHSTRRLCHRYQLFFFIAFFLVVIQLMLAYNFYSINQQESGDLIDLKRRLKVLEFEHKKEDDSKSDDTDNDMNKVVKEARKQNGQGAAEGPSNVKRLPEIEKLNQSNQKLNPRLKNKLKEDTRHQRNTRLPGTSSHDTEFHHHPKCMIESKDALSAIVRARTQQCKQQIADVACKEVEGTLYKRKLPRYCPLKDNNEGEYMGCFRDSSNSRILGAYHMEFREDNTPGRCLYFCLRAGFQYAGVQFSYECWCGDHLPRDKKVVASACDSACSGNHSEVCGGYLATNIYRTGFGVKAYGHAAYVKPEDILPNEKRVRIVFVLTVNGRAFRQVKRLFKVLYHTDHYYYFHVDSRQEYLHRELSSLADRFPNVAMAPHRFSTIWGGASLLTMLLSCMRGLVNMPDWKWDFFINISESDYPVKPLDDLVAFLTRHKSKNFVRSHGRDTPRFIRKQGLDKTFHECDTHMWRLGSRRMPDGIRIDGGSDWIALNRDFIQYIVTSTDELVTGLYQYYKYTLLPAESFFHTLLQNSEFCTTMVNNNLHLTNWRRKQGCKCQYKHIVDWCGCSPNDFLSADIDKLLGNEHRPEYFARKFEAIVNQEVINELDAYLDGNYPADTPGLTSYWQNDYHHHDIDTQVDEAYLTFYRSFSHLGMQQVRSLLGGPRCSYTPEKVLESSLYCFSDQFQGVLVRYSAKKMENGVEKIRIFETYVQPQKKYRVLRPIGPVSRIRNLEVGTFFDPKEELFRNFGGLLGPYSDISLTHSWGAGQQFTATVVWIDPAHVVAGSYDIPIKSEETTSNFKPTFHKPLRPGVWTVKLLYLWEVAVETEFLITPLSVYGGRDITNDEAKKLHNGPEGNYGERDLSDLKSFLQLQDSEGAKVLADSNGRKTGDSLESWRLKLTSQMWHISDTCISGTPISGCPRLSSCQQTSWSSLSPDPKSVVGLIKDSGRIR